MFGLSAAAEGSQKETAVQFRMRGEMQFKEERQTKSVSYRWKQPNREDRANVKKEEKLRCTLLNGSAWSTERKYMRRYRGYCDIFFGIEHRLRKEDMEEHFINREAKEGLRYAADAARITDERASSEDRKHKSGGVFIAVDSNFENSCRRKRRSSGINLRQ